MDTGLLSWSMSKGNNGIVLPIPKTHTCEEMRSWYQLPSGLEAALTTLRLPQIARSVGEPSWRNPATRECLMQAPLFDLQAKRH